MKVRALLLTVGIALVPLAWSGAAQAQDMPDLPGMGAAQKLVANQDPGEAAADPSATSETSESDAGAADTALVGSAVPDAGVDSGSLPELPGIGVISVLEAEKAKASLPVAGAGLEAWAALGSVAAVGGLYALRRFGVL